MIAKLFNKNNSIISKHVSILWLIRSNISNTVGALTQKSPWGLARGKE